MIGTLVYGQACDVADAQLLDDVDRVARVLETACIVGEATVLQVAQHRFQPQGCTVVALLSESHAAVHTYPEEGSYLFDVFTCGTRADACAIARCICAALGGRFTMRLVGRGCPSLA